MADKHPRLRRPKRKLCYLTSKDSGSTKWEGNMTLGDVDRMFDDLDSLPLDDGLLSPPLLQAAHPRTQHNDRAASPVPQENQKIKSKIDPPCQKGPEGTVLPAMRSTSPQEDIDLFKLIEPVKTSSPIDEIVKEVDVKEDKALKSVVSPILFHCEDEEKEEEKIPAPTIQEPQVNGNVTEITDDSDWEVPPSKFSFRRPTTLSTHKNKVDGSCSVTNSQPVTEKTHTQKPQTAVSERKKNTQRQENTDRPVAAGTQEPELAAADKQSTSLHSQSLGETVTRTGKDMSAFLQKLRDAGQSKPACGSKALTPVTVPAPPPPEPEDDFLILEDDGPLWFTIPNKSATSKRQKQSRTDSSDKDSSKDSPQETGHKVVESENSERGVHHIDQSTKRKKGPQKKNKVAGPETDQDELTTPEDPPAGDLAEQEKPNKKKRQQRLKKIPSKESDKAEEEAKDTASRETDQEKPKTERKKRSKSSKDGKETAKTNTSKSFKRNRKVMQGPEEIKETENEEAVNEESEDHNNKKPSDVEDVTSLSDQQIMSSDVRTTKDSTDGEAKYNKLPVVDESISSEESLGKRRRKPTGHWWLCDPLSTEETKVTDNHLTSKRSKLNSKEPCAAGSSPVKTQKDKVLKKTNQKRPVPSLKPSAATGKEKKTRRNKKRAAGEAPNKIRATDEVTTVTEQMEEQQEEREDVLDSGQSSPVIFQERDISHNSVQQVFQKVYHNVTKETMSDTSVSVSPRGPQERLRAADPEKGKRKPPGTWWTMDNMSEETESASSHPQPQQPNPKESKSPAERKKLSKQKASQSPGLKTPKKGKTLVASKTPGGADVPLLKPKPMFAPKTGKRSLATFKDIFSSMSETPTVGSSRDAEHNDRRGETAQPAAVLVTERVTVSRTDRDAHSVDAGEFSSAQNSPPAHDSPQDSRSQPENTSKHLMSGPSSMVELQEYENDELSLLSSVVPAALSVSDLCAPPLKPMILQQKDKADLTEWFKTLWSSTVDGDGEITPDHFDWFFYQGRVCGFQVDLNCGSVCNGKILLGSYMKKPLWVDHSATTVFNILTSSVAVIIDGTSSQFNAGQAFMVLSGHAYSIHNTTAQPAVLYFTRILAESAQ